MKKMIKKIAAAFMAMALVAVGILAANKTNVSAATGTKWIIAGDNADLFGTAWNPGNEDNAMADTDADGVYTKVYTAVAAGTYSFKVTNGTWDVAYGDNGGNYTLVVETTCDVTISFDTATDTVSATGSGVATGGPVLAETYFVRGEINSWSATESQMTDNGDGTYSITFEDVETSFAFKVAQDAPNAPNDGWYKSWGASAAGQSGDNATATVTEKSDVTITITPSQDKIDITVTPVQITPPADDDDDDTTTPSSPADEDDDDDTTTPSQSSPADEDDDDDTTTPSQSSPADEDDDDDDTTPSQSSPADEDDDDDTTPSQSSPADDENGNGAGGGTGSGSVDDTPAGDNSMVAIFAILAVLAAAGVVTVVVAKRRAIEE